MPEIPFGSNDPAPQEFGVEFLREGGYGIVVKKATWPIIQEGNKTLFETKVIDFGHNLLLVPLQGKVEQLLQFLLERSISFTVHSVKEIEDRERKRVAPDEGWGSNP